MKVSVLTFAALIATVTSMRSRDSLDPTVECTVYSAHGFTPPGVEEAPAKYLCTDSDGYSLRMDDAQAILGDSFSSGHTKLRIPKDAISMDNTVEIDQQFISVEHESERRQMTKTGTYSVLVIRVVDAFGNSAKSSAQLYDDIFNDENNLRVRYEQCSNGQLIFDPATGVGVNGGVMTVTTTLNLGNYDWQDCGNIAIGDEDVQKITRDYTFVICPDIVDFEGAAAWGQMGGSITWYRDVYASAPIVQVHEVGHNLRHAHSGENGVTYADPTCNMGNRGSWSDTGSAFCFNGPKTWANGWFSAYHQTATPSSTAFDGYLAGINAVVDGGIQAGEKVIVQITGSGETTLYIMYNRKAGLNSGVPNYGDEVTIVSQGSLTYSTSSVVASLSQGQVYTQNNWGSSSNSLKVEVCSISTSTPGNAHILAYVDGVNNLSCSTSTPPPTPVPTPATPTAAPNVTPPPTPVPTPATPTAAPNVTPEQCQDRKNKFAFKNRKLTCSFIGGKPNTQNRCRRPEARDACPVTCATGCQCFDTQGRFKMGRISRTCRWAARKNTAQRCRNNRVYTNCPITCGVCEGEQ